MNFNDITYPVIGLSPMDGVSDAPFRYITNKYGKPDLILSEFVHVVGLCRGGERLWQDFIFTDNERPISGQIFGAEPEWFYHAAKIICELGFNGVDINMGCPAKTVAEHGAGAALIRTPELAQEIVRQVQKGVKDWYETGELTGIKDEMKQRVIKMVAQRKQRAEQDSVEFKRYANGNEREMVPVSVKTRLGFDQITITDWIKYLADVSPAWITLHGRTLKQLYAGEANWDAIAAGVQAVPHIPVIANGDIKTYADIVKILEVTGAKGVLVGRATEGNPWFFKEIDKLKQFIAKDPNQTTIPEMYVPTLEERFNVMLEHVKLHVQLKGDGAFIQMRKHMAWYMNGFEGALDLRKKLMATNNVADVEKVVSEF